MDGPPYAALLSFMSSSTMLTLLQESGRSR